MENDSDLTLEKFSACYIPHKFDANKNMLFNEILKIYSLKVYFK